jgi:hypothetical protein
MDVIFSTYPSMTLGIESIFGGWWLGVGACSVWLRPLRCDCRLLWSHHDSVTGRQSPVTRFNGCAVCSAVAYSIYLRLWHLVKHEPKSFSRFQCHSLWLSDLTWSHVAVGIATSAAESVLGKTVTGPAIQLLIFERGLARQATLLSPRLFVCSFMPFSEEGGRSAPRHKDEGGRARATTPFSTANALLTLVG